MLRLFRSRQRRIELPFVKRPRRQFHSTPVVRNDSHIDAAARFGSNLHAFHDLFQHVHEYTSLPWLLSIPLATILVRSLITPVRYYYALCRRDQRRAEPELRMTMAIIEKQAKMRSDAGITAVKDDADNDVWIDHEWETRTAEIQRKYPRLAPRRFLSSASNRDITAIGAQLLVLVNTSTIISQSCRDPMMFQLGAIESLQYPLLVCFTILAMSNSNYYSDNPLSHPEDREGGKPYHRTALNPFKWTLNEALVTGVVFLPIFTAVQLASFPTVVALSCLSNSAYTWIERHSINLLLKMPSVSKGFETKAAVQSTKRKRWTTSGQSTKAVP